MIENARLADHVFLAPMLSDAYFPKPLVEKGQRILIELCEQIEEEGPADEEAQLALTHATTERFNELQEDFWNAGSELETAAREAIAGDIMRILEAYGWDLEIEDAISPRDW